MTSKKHNGLNDINNTDPHKTITEQNHNHLTIGTVLNNKYLLKEVVSNNSGEASIFTCTFNSKTYVAKVYFENHRHKADISQKIKNINSMYVIPILDEGRVGNRYYEIMPYYYQGDILQQGQVSYKMLKQLIIPCINQGLKDIHAAGILHKDIKPSNIFFSDDKSKVIIGDFGISSALSTEKSIVYTTKARTLGYAAPETAQGYFTKESDYYAFGVTIFHLALGYNPFKGKTEQQIILDTLSKPIDIPDTINPKLASLIKGLTQKDRKKRWGYNEVSSWLNQDNEIENSFNLSKQQLNHKIKQIKSDTSQANKQADLIFTTTLSMVLKMIITIVAIESALGYLLTTKELSKSPFIYITALVVAMLLLMSYRLLKTVRWLFLKRRYKKVSNAIGNRVEYLRECYLADYYNNKKSYNTKKVSNSLKGLINQREKILNKANMALVNLKSVLIVFLLLTSLSYLQGDLPAYLNKVAEVIGINLKTEQDYLYYTPKLKACNVRSQGSLDSKVLYIVYKGDKLKYLNQSTTDNEGRVWYYIQTDKGTGWISKNIIVLVAE